ncbi:MAG: leucine-rich repeat protein, partial [Lachnospiraceae bacterium]|nr:leucine-rich repeat protein [Lachnospiraceae bacterium]
VKKIGNIAFRGNSKLRWVKMTDSVQEIGDGAFQDCKNLEDIRLSDSIRELGESCFFNCPKLESITLPASIEKIKHSTFSEATITTIICPSGFTEFDLRCKNYTNGQIDNLPFGKGTFYVPEVDADSFLAGYAAGLRWDYLPIGLETDSLTIQVGEKYPLRLKGGAKATWKTSNREVATVGSSGDIYAKKTGKATITATIYGKEYPCQVTVVKHTNSEPVSVKKPTTAPAKPEPSNGEIPLSEEYFPDENFREFLSLCVDVNHDGILSQKERDLLTSIRNTSEQPEMIEYEYEDFGTYDPRFWPRHYLDRVLSFQGTEYFRHLQEFVIMDFLGGRAADEIFLTGDDLEIFMTNRRFEAIHIEKQEKLQHFYMYAADGMEFIDLSGTKNLKSLKILGYADMDFKVLAENKKLRTVYISANKMAEEDFIYLGQMPNVEFLVVYGKTEYPVELIDLSADTKLEYFHFAPDQLSKLILPSKDVQFSLSCELIYPEISYSSDHTLPEEKIP